MELRTRRPDPPLDEFVEVFWSFEGYAPAHSRERLLPDGSTELVINLAEDRTSIYDREDPSRVETCGGAIVAGPHSQFFVIDTSGQCSTVGIHFKPGGAFPFLGLPAGELHNLQVPLDDLWGAFARDLRCRVLEVPTPEARLRMLEVALMERAPRNLALHPAVRFALDQFGQGPHVQRIGEVTEEIGLSPRRFIELFRQQVGMPPKLFCRVRRFQQVVQRIAAGRPVEWTDVALDAGYFDQAHFIHDFRAFSGCSPAAYAALHVRNPNHVPLSD